MGHQIAITRSGPSDPSSALCLHDLHAVVSPRTRKADLKACHLVSVVCASLSHLKARRRLLSSSDLSRLPYSCLQWNGDLHVDWRVVALLFLLCLLCNVGCPIVPHCCQELTDGAIWSLPAASDRRGHLASLSQRRRTKERPIVPLWLLLSWISSPR